MVKEAHKIVDYIPEDKMEDFLQILKSISKIMGKENCITTEEINLFLDKNQNRVKSTSANILAMRKGLENDVW